MERRGSGFVEHKYSAVVPKERTVAADHIAAADMRGGEQTSKLELKSKVVTGREQVPNTFESKVRMMARGPGDMYQTSSQIYGSGRRGLTDFPRSGHGYRSRQNGHML